MFRLRLTANVEKLINRAFCNDNWSEAGQDWQGKGNTRQLSARRQWHHGIPFNVDRAAHKRQALLAMDLQLLLMAIARRISQ